LSNFYKIGVEEDVLSSHPHAIQSLWLYKCGLTAPKSAKICNFGINFPQGVYPLSNMFLQNWRFGVGEEFKILALTPNFIAADLKCWVTAPFFLSFFFSYSGWHTLPSHASAEACLTGWPNAQPQGRD